jgi:outer membrane protein assembly factor BamE
MPAMPPRRTLSVLAVFAFAALLAGCGSVDSTSRRIATAFTPYKIEIVQGNFVSKEQVEALRPGMSREQVRQILGTPLVTSLFHGDRWDYVFTLRRQGVEPQQRRLTVYFTGENLQRVEGDTMPSESEFVATLDNKRRASGKTPKLEASEQELRAFSSKQPAAAAQPAAPATPPNVSYPPLEPAAR